ncbi:MAG TPA: acyl-CoA dehydrogenase family protein [bacterium]|nr:acyl-CoA dehydrogenase family protein [bacterium]
MDFSLTEEQQLIHQTVREFAERELRPHATQWDREGVFPRALTPKIAELGLWGMTVPSAYGGSEVDVLSMALAIEALAWGDGGVALSVASHNSLCTGHLVLFASEEQKRRYLPALASGETLGAWCLTEPGAGSDAGAIQTRAERRNGDWILSGTKVFVTQGSIGGVYVVMAVSDPAAGRDGISAFIVERDNPGLRVGKKEDKLGVRSSDTAEVVFEECVVTDAALVGRPGEGYRQAMRVLEGGRIGIAAMALGLGRAALDASVSYAQDRRAFGRPIGEHQALGFMMADMAAELDAAWLLVARAATLAQAGRPFRREASMAKLYAAEAAARAAARGVQIHGGYGFVKGAAVERIYRDVKLTEIGEGTSEIQRIIIAKSLLEE